MSAPAAAQELWPSGLPLDLALGIDGELDIAQRHGISLDQLNRLLATPAFQLEVAIYRKDLHEAGESFRAKARAQAEELLKTSYALAQNPSTPAAVRADLIKSTVEWADLKPKKNQEPTGTGFSITFNFPVPSGAPAPESALAKPKGITIDNRGNPV